MADCKPAGKFTNKAFEKYGDWNTLTRLIQDTSGGNFKGVSDFNAAVKRSDKSILAMPDQLIADFVYGNVENGLRAQGHDDAAIDGIVRDTVSMMRKGTFADEPSTLPPSSPLTDNAGGRATAKPTEVQGTGGISGVGGTGEHGAAGSGRLLWTDEDQRLADASLKQEPFPGEWGYDANGNAVDGQGFTSDGSPGTFRPGTEPKSGPLKGRSTVDTTARLVTGRELPGSVPTVEQRADAALLKTNREDFLDSLRSGADAIKTFNDDQVGAINMSKIADMFKVKPGDTRLFTGKQFLDAGYDISFKNLFKDFNDAERALTASGDDSFILNQGFISLFAHPTALGPAFIDSLKALVGGNKALQKTNAKLNALPSHNLARRVGLRFDNLGDSEFFTGGGPFSEALRRAPVLGGFIEHGDAAYSASGNVLRGRIFDTYANSWGLMKALGETNQAVGSREYAKAWKEAQDLRDFVHVITGVGDVSALPKLMQDIGPLFFAYKFMASKINILLGPLQYTQQAFRGTLGDVLPSRLGVGLLSERGLPMPIVLSPEHASSWRMAALAWRDLGLYTVGVGATAWALKQAGFDVETDPNSGKFMQVQIGSTVWDLTGGMSRPFGLLWQTFVSHEHKSATGRTYGLDDPSKKPFGEQSLQDLWINYLTGRLAPGYSQGLQVFRGQNFQGKPPTPWDIFPLPITLKNAIESLVFNGIDSNDLGLITTFLGAHGYDRGTNNEPGGPLGTPIKDLMPHSTQEAPDFVPR